MSSIDVSKIKLFQLRAFVAVADSGSFGGAAARLDLSQSAVSHAIATLESELGVILFFRSRQGAVLTFVGEQTIGQARQILEILENLADTAHASRGLQSGQIRIAALRSLATHWLPPMMAQFNQQFPNIHLKITKYFDYTEVQTALYNHSADIGLMDVYNTDGLRVVDIGVDDYVGLLPINAEKLTNAESSNPNPSLPQLTWQYLNQYPLIMPATSDCGYDALRTYVDGLQHKPQIGYEINEDSTIVSMVAQGMGAAILPYLAALPIPDTVQVHRLEPSLTRRLAAVILEDQLHSPPIFAFLEMVQSFRLKGFS